MDDEFFDTLAERGATYGLLARLYQREIDVELLEVLAPLPLDGCEGARLMRTYLDNRSSAATTELSVDFAHLFLVRTAKTKDAPYPNESVYASTDGTIMGDARDAVLASYRAEGLDKSSSWNLPEDHIALELEFLQTLCQRVTYALREGNEREVWRLLEVQQKFITLHIGRWTKPFTQAMECWAQTDFYRGLALFTAVFLEEDTAFLEKLLNSR